VTAAGANCLARSQVLGELKALTSALHEPALIELVGAFAGASGSMKTGSVPEVLAMEFATGLLLTEDDRALRGCPTNPETGRCHASPPDFAQRGVLLPAAEEDLLDDRAPRPERMLPAGGARNPGEPAARREGARRVLPRFERTQRARRPGYTRQIQVRCRCWG
jgi:hypothetical protein